MGVVVYCETRAVITAVSHEPAAVTGPGVPIIVASTAAIWTRVGRSARLRACATLPPPSCSAGSLLVMPATSMPSMSCSILMQSSTRRRASHNECR
jgi:hypothetical protein